MDSENLDKSCRCCLSSEDLNYVLHDKLLEAYMNITLIRDLDNALSDLLCSECNRKLQNVVEFSEVCKKSYEFFKTESKPLMVIIKEENSNTSREPFPAGEDDANFDDFPDENSVDYDDIKNEQKEDVKKLKKSRTRSRKTPQPSRPQQIKTACVTCHEEYPNLSSLKEHYRENAECGPRRHKCKFCQKMFKDNYQMTVHINARHLDIAPTFSCEQCSLTFKWKSNLKRHQKIHSGNIDYKECHICSRKFGRQSSLQEHIKSVHYGVKSFVCDQCGKAFKKNQNLLIHSIRHKVKNETATDEEIKKLVKHSSHDILENQSIQQIHENIVQKHPELKDLECRVCGNFYSTKGALRTHLMSHTGEKNFLCTECGKSFTTKGILQSHSRVHSDAKPFQCTTCPSNFRHKSTLQAHMDMHLGVKSYTCDLCGKTFRQLPHLKYHMRMHSGVKPFKCTFCNKNFANNTNLKIHKRIHTGETPFHCPVCGKGFYDSGSMQKHKKKHHLDENLKKEEIPNKDLISC